MPALESDPIIYMYVVHPCPCMFIQPATGNTGRMSMRALPPAVHMHACHSNGRGKVELLALVGAGCAVHAARVDADVRERAAVCACGAQRSQAPGGALPLHSTSL